MSRQLGAAQIAAQVAAGEVSAEQVVTTALQQIDARPELGAAVHRDDAHALEVARAIDQRRRHGKRLGPLAGVPIAVKDNICTIDLPTTCGSSMLAGYRSPFDATAVARLRAADAVLIAKTNCDEFAMGSSTEASCFGPTRHPLDPSRVAGGSSGGSTVMVAAHQVPLALGSDTGGSVRQPAAFCGVVGLKPTYGTISRWGLVAFGSSLDQIGMITRSIDDAALALALVAGPDEYDATISTVPLPRLGSDRASDLRGQVIGVWRHALDSTGIDPRVARAVEQAAQALSAAGAQLRDVELPLGDQALAIYYLISSAEASSNLARFDGVRYGRRSMGTDLVGLYARSRAAGFGTEVKRRIMLGTFALSAGHYDAYYGRAQAARSQLRAQLDQVCADGTIVLLPTTPTPAFRLGEKLLDPLAMYLSDVFTVAANLGGHPAISVPAPRAENELPVGVQLMAGRHAERELLTAARVLEQVGFVA